MTYISKVTGRAALALMFLLPALSAAGEGSARADGGRHVLRYTSPAREWMTSCLPIGDGQSGATIMGGVETDDIQFNDKTLWDGKLGSITSTDDYGRYLNFGNLTIRSVLPGQVSGYSRSLNIDDAVASVRFTAGGTAFERTYFASNPDSVIVIRYRASRRGAINCVLSLRSGQGKAGEVDGKGSTLFFSGEARRYGDDNAPVAPLRYYAAARVSQKGGTMTSTGGEIRVADAREMIVCLHPITDFLPLRPQYSDPSAPIAERTTRILDRAAAQGYKRLLTAHMADYKRLYDRCSLRLAPTAPDITTPELISRYAADPLSWRYLEELYFSYGRYLLISSARGVSLPANLQGIWNNTNDAAWHSDIHSNINVEMNYWPAEPTNLSELHLTFLDYIHREACIQPQWRRNARDIAGVDKGWAITTENNIYGSGTVFKQNYTIANAWYCQHLWQHFRYTLDTAYLRTTAWPAMRSCAEYWLARLKKAADGTWECPDEWSPEHGPDENATAHSQQLVWQLFHDCLEAASPAGEHDAAFLDLLSSRFRSLDDGCHTETHDGRLYLREWKYTSQFGYDWRAHRHLSHLMGLYPGSEIGLGINDSIFMAAANSLQARTFENATGWSLGHRINLGARARLAPFCHSLIVRALRLSTSTDIDQTKGGIYENLWDAHAPFQIDGNFGFTAGVAEMLLQSRFGVLEILPALPADYWRDGEVTGLKAVGNFTVDIAWSGGRATGIVTRSASGPRCTVSDPGMARLYTLSGDKAVLRAVSRSGDDRITFPTMKGGVYRLNLQK